MLFICKNVYYNFKKIDSNLCPLIPINRKSAVFCYIYILFQTLLVLDEYQF